MSSAADDIAANGEPFDDLDADGDLLVEQTRRDRGTDEGFLFLFFVSL